MTRFSVDWMDDAACRGYKLRPGEHWPWDTDPILGLPPEEKEAAQHRRLATARRICGTCPVTGFCMYYGMNADRLDNLVEEVYGGMTPEERAAFQGTHVRMQSGNRRYADQLKAQQSGSKRPAGPRADAA